MPNMSQVLSGAVDSEVNKTELLAFQAYILEGETYNKCR